MRRILLLYVGPKRQLKEWMAKKLLLTEIQRAKPLHKKEKPPQERYKKTFTS